MNTEQKQINILRMLEDMMSDWSDDLTFPASQLTNAQIELNNRVKAGTITQLQSDELYDCIYRLNLLVKNRIN